MARRPRGDAIRWELIHVTNQRRALVTGAGGFIGGHLVRRLLDDGWWVTAVDIKPTNEWWQKPKIIEDALCYGNTDAGQPKLFLGHIKRANVIFHLAANMGGMGYIESHLVDCAENIIPTINLLRAVQPGQKFFFSSSACVYPGYLQNGARLDGDGHVPDVYLAEANAYPADPEPGYGWEKLFAEQLVNYHAVERGIVPHIARFHNSYGPHGSWGGGREKAPAALCRKVAIAKLTGASEISVWGDGTQRRSFMYVDDNVEGIVRLLDVDHEPVNLGSAHAVTIRELAELIIEIGFGRPDAVKIIYEPGPLGVASRCSDNSYVQELLNWEPQTSLRDGIERTYSWIYGQVKRELEER